MLIMHDNAGWPTSLLFSLFICLSCYTQICLQEKVKQSNPNPRVSNAETETKRMHFQVDKGRGAYAYSYLPLRIPSSSLSCQNFISKQPNPISLLQRPTNKVEQRDVLKYIYIYIIYKRRIYHHYLYGGSPEALTTEPAAVVISSTTQLHNHSN